MILKRFNFIEAIKTYFEMKREQRDDVVYNKLLVKNALLRIELRALKIENEGLRLSCDLRDNALAMVIKKCEEIRKEQTKV